LTDSLPATVAISIRPTAASFGDLVISEDSLPAIVLLNVANGDVGILSSGGLLGSPAFLTTEPGGTILVATNRKASCASILPRERRLSSCQIHWSQVPSAWRGKPMATSSSAPWDRLGESLHQRRCIRYEFPGWHAGVSGRCGNRADGQIFVTDPGAAFGSPPNAIVQLEPSDTGTDGVGHQRTVDLARGDRLGTERQPGRGGSVLQHLDARHRAWGGSDSSHRRDKPESPFGVAVDVSGNIYVANGDGSVTQVNPVTGAQTVVVPPGSIGSPFGIAVAGQPVAPPLLTGVQLTSAGQAQISLTGYPGATYSVLRSADFDAAAWWLDTRGHDHGNCSRNFSATDSGATNAPVRFYRASYP